MSSSVLMSSVVVKNDLISIIPSVNITSERIIDIQQKGFFSRVIAEHKLFRIQDVTSEVHGIIPTVFKYGDVYIQTAGTKQRFFFNQVPNPERVRNIIIKLVQRNKKKIHEEMKLESKL